MSEASFNQDEEGRSAGFSVGKHHEEVMRLIIMRMMFSFGFEINISRVYFYT